MGGAVFVILCLLAPFAIMWWLLRVQRRVRAMSRRPETAVPDAVAYTDEMRSADGLIYSRRFEVNEELLAADRRSGEPSDLKNLQGQR